MPQRLRLRACRVLAAFRAMTLRCPCVLPALEISAARVFDMPLRRRARYTEKRLRYTNPQRPPRALTIPASSSRLPSMVRPMRTIRQGRSADFAAMSYDSKVKLV